jgi:hypothetical protein
MGLNRNNDVVGFRPEVIAYAPFAAVCFGVVLDRAAGMFANGTNRLANLTSFAD